MSRNNLTITVSDVRSTKTYTVHQIIKKILVYIIIFVIASLLLAGGIIFFLTNELGDLEKKKEIISKEQKSLLVKNDELAKLINEKNDELDLISTKVEDIEKLIGLDSNNSTNLSEKVDIAKISFKEKKSLLMQIPSGSPVKFKGITSKYGTRFHPVLKRKDFHPGLDMRAGMRTRIYAPADGVVELVRKKKTGYGNLLVISHNFGFKTVYGHLYKSKVKVGDIVKKGDVVALTGNSGLSSGPHLHYEVKYLNAQIDPTNFVNWNMKNYSELFEKEKKVKWQSLINLAKKQMLEQR